jgi:hypothetical protein
MVIAGNSIYDTLLIYIKTYIKTIPDSFSSNTNTILKSNNIYTFKACLSSINSNKNGIQNVFYSCLM